MSRALYQLSTIYTESLTFGCEVEFYLSENCSYDELALILPEYRFIKERGKNQIEYHIGPDKDPKRIITAVKNSIKIIRSELQRIGASADFSPKPVETDFGNALQIQFTSNSDIFQASIDRICSSFCQYAKRTFLAYAGNISDYSRFNKDFMTPTHIGYGYNNRSCLIRICGDQLKRIEVRAPSPICDLYVVFCTILQQIVIASSETGANYQKIYGIASDAQYGLEPIPSSLEEAELLFDVSFFKYSPRK